MKLCLYVQHFFNTTKDLKYHIPVPFCSFFPRPTVTIRYKTNICCRCISTRLQIQNQIQFLKIIFKSKYTVPLLIQNAGILTWLAQQGTRYWTVHNTGISMPDKRGGLTTCIEVTMLFSGILYFNIIKHKATSELYRDCCSGLRWSQVGTQSDIRDQRYRTEPDIGTSNIRLKCVEFDIISDIGIIFCPISDIRH